MKHFNISTKAAIESWQSTVQLVDLCETGARELRIQYRHNAAEISFKYLKIYKYLQWNLDYPARQQTPNYCPPCTPAYCCFGGNSILLNVLFIRTKCMSPVWFVSRGSPVLTVFPIHYVDIFFRPYQCTNSMIIILTCLKGVFF